MCGRYTLRANLNRILTELGAVAAPDNVWNANADIRPTTQVPIVRVKDGGRELAPVRWGLVPPWKAEPKTKYSTINAKAETVAEKPTYRSAFKKKRCLVVADGYDEWKVVGGTEKKPIKQRYHMHFPDDRVFAFAGLWEHWERDGQTCDSASIIITSASAELANIHDRMPVILREEDFPLWLDPAFEGKDKLLGLFQPYPTGELVSTAI